MELFKKIKEEILFEKNKLIYFPKESFLGKYKFLLVLTTLLLLIELLNLKLKINLLVIIEYLIFLILFVYIFPSFYLNQIKSNLKENLKNFLKAFFVWLLVFLFFQIILIGVLAIFLFFYISKFTQALNNNNLESLLFLFSIQPIYFVILFLLMLIDIYIIVFLPLKIIKNLKENFFSLIGKSFISIKEVFNFKVLLLLTNLILTFFILSKINNKGFINVISTIYTALTYYLFSYLVLFLYYNQFMKIIEKKEEKILITNLFLLIFGLFLVLLKSMNILESDKSLLVISIIYLIFSFPFSYLMHLNFILFILFLLSF